MRSVGSSTFQPTRRTILEYLRESVRTLYGKIYQNESGATAVEFPLIAGFLVLLLLNGVELGRYTYLRGQVENAAQAGAHSLWEKCDPMKLPIVTKCYSSQAAAQMAVASVVSSIVNDLANDNVSVSEGYYCPDTAGALHSVTNIASIPTQCLSGVVPGDYVQVQITYSFTPLFGNLTVAAVFGTSITMTSYMRLQ